MRYKTLFSPISINQLRLSNRVVMAPCHTGLNSIDGFVTQSLVDFWVRRARGGASALVIGAVLVSAKRWPGVLRINDEKFVPGLRSMVEYIHQESDAKVFVQLFDVLKVGRMGYKQDVADLDIKEIKQCINDFGEAAKRAKEAGFDGIELHAAHGYLLASFLSLQNKRPDEYGKSILGRMRLVTEVYQKVREAVGNEYVVGIRINGDEFIIGGNTLQQSRIIARRLAEMGIDYISVSAGGKYEDSRAAGPAGILQPYPPFGGYSGFRCMPPAYMPEGVNVYLAEGIRKAIRDAGYSTPVITAGRIPHPRLAERILSEGQADLVGLCRPLLRDPDWVTKAKEGRTEEIIKCKYCNACIGNILAGPTICQYAKE